MPQFPAVINLSSLNGVNGFKINGVAAGDQSGLSVASAGDINGDGFADFIIGAENASPGGKTFAGASYVVFGKAAGLPASFDLSTLNSINGFQLNGEAVGNFTGASVASAGDVNGDGFADIIVGARGADTNGNAFTGASYVVFGKASTFAANLELSTLGGSNGFKISGAGVSDFSGRSVASAGDINGDGFADIIIGAYHSNPLAKPFSGASYVVFGHAGGFAPNINLTSLNGANGFKIPGEGTNDLSGYSVASAGDVNGDGIGDIIVGSYHAGPNGLADSGASYVVFGKTSGFSATLDLGSLNGANGFQLNGEFDGDKSGGSVSGAGDINGDGFADIIIGADASNAGGNRAGASFVVFGKASGFAANIELLNLNGTNGFQINGADLFDNSGGSVAAAGDVNGDGFADIIIGAIGAQPNGQRFAGDSFVVFGKASGFAADLNLATLNGTNGFKIEGVTSYDRSGQSVASAGDINGDGFSDLIVGAFGADPHGNASGASYVIYGVKPTTAVVRTGTVASQTLAGGDLGDTLKGLGGNDRLYGNGGKDKIDGGTGNDYERGGLGKDTMTGGAGKDVFDFNAITETGKKASTRDVITDFKHGQDKIDLKDIDANIKKLGDQAFKFIGTADFHHVKGELHYAKIDMLGTKHDITLVSGDINGDGNADFSIELSHLVTLTKGDFVL